MVNSEMLTFNIFMVCRNELTYQHIKASKHIYTSTFGFWMVHYFEAMIFPCLVYIAHVYLEDIEFGLYYIDTVRFSVHS